MKKLYYLIFLILITHSAFSQEADPAGISFFIPNNSPTALNLTDVLSRISFPKDAIKENIQEIVTIKILVDRNGAVVRTGSFRGSTILYNAVLNEIYALRFDTRIPENDDETAWLPVHIAFMMNVK